MGTRTATMTTEAKGKLIGAIIAQLRLMANTEGKPFEAGDTFFALAFKSDDELQHIARLLGI